MPPCPGPLRLPRTPAPASTSCPWTLSSPRSGPLPTWPLLTRWPLRQGPGTQVSNLTGIGRRSSPTGPEPGGGAAHGTPHCWCPRARVAVWRWSASSGVCPWTVNSWAPDLVYPGSQRPELTWNTGPIGGRGRGRRLMKVSSSQNPENCRPPPPSPRELCLCDAASGSPLVRAPSRANGQGAGPRHPHRSGPLPPRWVSSSERCGRIWGDPKLALWHQGGLPGGGSA